MTGVGSSNRVNVCQFSYFLQSAWCAEVDQEVWDGPLESSNRKSSINLGTLAPPSKSQAHLVSIPAKISHHDTFPGCSGHPRLYYSWPQKVTLL